MSENSEAKNSKEFKDYQKINKESEDSMQINNPLSLNRDMENVLEANIIKENKLEVNEKEQKEIITNPVDENRFGLTNPFLFIGGEPYISLSPNCKLNNSFYLLNIIIFYNLFYYYRKIKILSHRGL